MVINRDRLFKKFKNDLFSLYFLATAVRISMLRCTDKVMTSFSIMFKVSKCKNIVSICRSFLYILQRGHLDASASYVQVTVI